MLEEAEEGPDVDLEEVRGQGGHVSTSFSEVLPAGLNSCPLPWPKVENSNGHFSQCVAYLRNKTCAIILLMYSWH